MSISWSDFFRPDAQSSNRSLKKFLESEGLEFGHRDLVTLRQLSEVEIYLSYAALEVWSEGEVDRSLWDQVLACYRAEDELFELMRSAGLSSVRMKEGTVLIGVDGECSSQKVDQNSSQSLVKTTSQSGPSSPLTVVFGGANSATGPTVGGVWDEGRLQRESLVLLDGESSPELVEAFRHLFRAAPNGSARASVVVAALSRHRLELDLEVSEKLEEVAPAFGQAMRRLFEDEPASGCRALQYLLRSEEGTDVREWSGFWRQIRSTIFDSLARTERGTLILMRSIDQLADAVSGDSFLNHQLLDAFLQRQDELTPSQQEKLIGLLCDWAVADSENSLWLSSRLELTTVQNERLLLGEALRRTYVSLEDEEALARLSQVFVEEAVSAGSTAGSLALADLLRSFGVLVVEKSAEKSAGLAKLTERQTLNLLEVWELAVSHQEEYIVRVGELFLAAVEEPAEHLSLLLKSELLRRPPIWEKFLEWLRNADVSSRHQILAVGFRWSLTVDNRSLLAAGLRSLEWGFQDLWEAEWRRPHLSYQRLGWLAICTDAEKLKFSLEVREQLAELLTSAPSQLYFWELMRCCAQAEEFPNELRDLLLKSSYRAFVKLESGQEEENESLFEVAAESLRRHSNAQAILLDWGVELKSAQAVRVEWISGLLEPLYRQGEYAPIPPRETVSALISRLLSSGEQSMNDLLNRALAATDKESEAVAEGSDFLPLQVSHRAYRALSTLATHKSCPEALRPLVRRRLALFLLSWSHQLQSTDDPYSYRETPLFALVTEYLDDPALEGLTREIAETFLELHRKHPTKFRLEVRYTAQELFRAWSQRHPQDLIAQGWMRALNSLVE